MCIRDSGETMLFFMLTDIIHQSTELLCYGGENARLVEEAFHQTPVDHSIILPLSLIHI